MEYSEWGLTLSINWLVICRSIKCWKVQHESLNVSFFPQPTDEIRHVGYLNMIWVLGGFFGHVYMSYSEEKAQSGFY